MRLLDTNNWIALIKGRAPSVMARLESLPASEIAVCSVVKAELWYGAHRYEDPEKRRAVITKWLSPYPSFSFDDEAAIHNGEIRYHLESAGRIIGPNDLKIAAICRAHCLTLVTANTGEFLRVPGLAVEDWSGDTVTS